MHVAFQIGHELFQSGIKRDPGPAGTFWQDKTSGKPADFGNFGRVVITVGAHQYPIKDWKATCV